MEAMDRTLNARRTASFPAVAIREDGVLETFAAALRLTMEHITSKFKLGAGVRNARSIEEWTAESMRAMFDWIPSTRRRGVGDSLGGADAGSRRARRRGRRSIPRLRAGWRSRSR